MIIGDRMAVLDFNGESVQGTEHLTPFSQLRYDQHRAVSKELYFVANEAKELLVLRGLGHVAANYGHDRTGALRMFADEHWQQAHEMGRQVESQKSFVIHNDKGNLVGVASLEPRAVLQTVGRFIPRRIGRHPFATTYPFAKPYIQAWSSPEAVLDGTLASAYEELVQLACEGDSSREGPKPWSLEPDSSPAQVHESIVGVGGLQKVVSARFTEPMGDLVLPEKHTLYAKPYCEWKFKDHIIKNRGILSELKRNMISLTTQEEIEEQSKLDVTNKSL